MWLICIGFHEVIRLLMPRAINVCKTLNPVQAFLVAQRGSDYPNAGDIQNQIG